MLAARFRRNAPRECACYELIKLTGWYTMEPYIGHRRAFPSSARPRTSLHSGLVAVCIESAWCSLNALHWVLGLNTGRRI